VILKLIVGLIQLASAVMSWLERARIKAEGKAEAYVEAKEVHDRRVVEALAARDDADALGMHDDPYNRDRH